MEALFTRFSKRKRLKIVLELCLCLIGFLILWTLLTFLILGLQDLILGPSDSLGNDETLKKNKGLQVVVGHYNGNLPRERRDNLTDEQLNANHYAPISGYGEGGVPVRLSIKEELESEETFPINQFNLYVSDRISINRSLPDIRKEACRKKIYPGVKSLPTTSVIIVYHNEAYSTLLRTMTSVINRSPSHLLQEIILVDDFSNRTFLRRPLNDFARGISGIPIKIIRSKSRVGLIRARLMGAQEASGDVLTFLDSHCECTIGWLEPLLSRIKEYRKAVVCPVIDVVNDRTFQYQRGIEIFRGGFNWSLQFRWYALPQAVAHARSEDPTSPIESPTMAGGLFSIDRRFFEEIGEYDRSMDIWGGENLELSFRIWQCGGRVEILPCSHVGHIFRKASPHDFPGQSSGKVLNKNLFRVAEVWMDEWKHLFYRIAPQSGALRLVQDVSDRIELRKRLACRSFHWYLKNVFTDHFLPMRGDLFGRIGMIDGGPCLKWTHSKTNGLRKADLAQSCSLNHTKWINSELWLYTVDKRLRTDEHLCLSAVQSTHMSSEWNVELKECAGYANEEWEFNREEGTIVHRKSQLCLTSPEETSIQKKEESLANLEGISPPIVRPCALWKTRRDQKWQFLDAHWGEPKFV